MSANTVVIGDSSPRYNLNQFTVPPHYEKYLDYILIPKGMLKDRIEKLSKDIHTDYKGKKIDGVCLLKGAFRFFNDIMHNIDVQNSYDNIDSVQFEPHFAHVTSYINEESTGDVNFDMKNIELVRGKDVLIVEDIIDTSKTMPFVVNEINKYSPKSLKVACLFLKRNPEVPNPFRPDYVGLSIPNKFIVGYSLDYNQAFRDLSHICVLNELGIETFNIENK